MRMTTNPLEARHAMRAKNASLSAKNSCSPDGPVGAMAPDGPVPRTRSGAIRADSVADSPAPPPRDRGERVLGTLSSTSAIVRDLQSNLCLRYSPTGAKLTTAVGSAASENRISCREKQRETDSLPSLESVHWFNIACTRK